jgi:hypothetical protein
MNTSSPEHRREGLRQRLLLRALGRDGGPAAVEGWLRGPPARRRRGLQAYRANAAALAERALAAAYPTVAELVGAETFALMARRHWQQQPPADGDIARWGAALPDAVAADPQLAAEAYLADVARLDWALHRAATAADDVAPPEGVMRLGSEPPSALCLCLRAGWAVLASAHPLHAIWAAHQRQGEHRFAAVRRAFAEGRAEAVRVRRHGLRARAERIEPPVARFEQALLDRQTLAAALAAAAPGFDFEAWLIDTLRRDGLSAVVPAT